MDTESLVIGAFYDGAMDHRVETVETATTTVEIKTNLWNDCDSVFLSDKMWAVTLDARQIVGTADSADELVGQLERVMHATETLTTEANYELHHSLEPGVYVFRKPAE